MGSGKRGQGHTTILDRLMHRAAMLEFEGRSYRLKEAAARIAVTADAS